MKNTIRSAPLIILFCLMAIVPVFAQDDPKQGKSNIDTKDKKQTTPKKHASLGFKGLNLGMSNDEVNDLVRSSPWGYMYVGYGKEDMSQLASYAFLEGDSSKEGLTWANIGCEGPKGEGGCYWLKHVHIQYFDKKVVQIFLSSSKYSADEIDTFVKDWGQFALKGLIEKYGMPDKNYKSIKDINVFSFKSGFNVPLYKWSRGKERIILSISESDATFGCNVSFEEIEGIRNVEKQKSESKAEF